MPIINERAYSVSPDALIEKGNVVYSGVSGGGGLPTTDSSIITLVTGETISANTIVSIGEDGKVFVASVYSQYSAIGAALNNAEADADVDIKISGVVAVANLSNCTTDNIYIGTDGTPADYFYEVNGYLQFVGYKIDANNLLLDVGKKVLML